MKARLERGYWVFAPPIGYRYIRDPVHGKLLVRAEPLASIVQEALEGYASGRFGSQAEVKRFFESKTDFPKDLHDGEIRAQKVTDIVTRVLYAGYVENPAWGVSLRRGMQEPLISLETHEGIQKKIKGRAKGPTRKGINADFPLRGFGCCDDCGRPFTAGWSKGKTKHYPYYLCDTRGCPSYRKSVARNVI